MSGSFDFNDLKNIFGDIRTTKGKTINFSKLDTSKNGFIELNEFNRAKSLYNVTDSFNNLDANSDGKISPEEYAALETNRGLQECINKFKSTIAADFSGIDSSFIPNVVSAIREFALGYTGSVEDFESSLQTFYNDLLNSAEFQAMPSRILDRSADNAFTSIMNAFEGREDVNITDSFRNKVFNTLLNVGETYIKAHLEDADLEQSVTAFLVSYMGSSDAQNLSGAVSSFNDKLTGYGPMISPNELKSMKNDVTELLTEALNLGISPIQLGGVNIRTTAAIKSALARYTDGNQLRTDVLNFIQNLSTQPKIEELYQGTLSPVDYTQNYSQLIETVFNSIVTNDMSEGLRNFIFRRLDSVGEAYRMANSANPNFDTDFVQYLRNWINSSDAGLMNDAVNTYNTAIGAFGDHIDSREFAQLKELAKQLLAAAVNNHIAVKLDGITITAGNINSVISRFSNGDDLKAAISELISSFSTKTMLEKLVEEYEASLTTDPEDPEDPDVPDDPDEPEDPEVDEHTRYLEACSACNVDLSLIDMSQLATLSGLDRASIQNFLNQNALKSQLRAQIMDIISQKSLSDDNINKIMRVFDNVYTDCINSDSISGLTTVDASEMSISDVLTGSIIIGIRDIVAEITSNVLTSFIQMLNDSMIEALNDMNASEQDLDIQDIDYSNIGNGNSTVQTAYELGSNLTAGSDMGTKLKRMINNLKNQFSTKARRMCSENNVSYNSSAFNRIFNNSRNLAIITSQTLAALSHSYNPRNAVIAFTTEFKSAYTSWITTQEMPEEISDPTLTPDTPGADVNEPDVPIIDEPFDPFDPFNPIDPNSPEVPIIPNTTDTPNTPDTPGADINDPIDPIITEEPFDPIIGGGSVPYNPNTEAPIVPGSSTNRITESPSIGTEVISNEDVNVDENSRTNKQVEREIIETVVNESIVNNNRIRPLDFRA